MMQRLTVAVLAVAIPLSSCACQDTRRALVVLFDNDYSAASIQPSSAGYDLQEVLTGFEQITDVQFLPGSSSRLVVLEKTGKAHWVDRTANTRGTLFEVDVATTSEQGLLGLAFHPRFDENGRFFVNYTPDSKTSRVSEFKAEHLQAPATEVRTILEVAQPYQNHNAGQIAFGPDGMLYIGWGDGGFRNDVDGNGQRRSTLLGSMLRVDIDGPPPYQVPPDNPWVAVPDVRPETWAYGLRNPWRFTFDPEGRMVLADVGQDTWEEVDLVQAGDNLGWPLREGAHCFPPDSTCTADGLVDPIHEYGRSLGTSITGGQVYLGSALPELHGKYVFGDFVSGRVWALALPEQRGSLVASQDIGQWPVLISTFSRDSEGEIYLGDYTGGRVMKLVQASNP